MRDDDDAAAIEAVGQPSTPQRAECTAQQHRRQRNRTQGLVDVRHGDRKYRCKGHRTEEYRRAQCDDRPQN